MDIPRLTDDELRMLAMPILAVIGGRDVLIDSAETRARLERFAPHAKICFIENGYHFLPGQSAEIDRVLRSYPELTDDAFVAEHLDRWLA